ncbi:hypothetical protein G5V59_08955 [Nocardioides sp. W3-2-3]|uniref:hypothetical protein n=1 Tax=Nocardioides convexus TaxID=2712224 RepID=UPI0024181B56|nr:hypothetical protein [Nocardioides convexus]NHA00214.1 hypothetical protein [Nocardioides convexus]
MDGVRGLQGVGARAGPRPASRPRGDRQQRLRVEAHEGQPGAGPARGAWVCCARSPARWR